MNKSLFAIIALTPLVFGTLSCNTSNKKEEAREESLDIRSKVDQDVEKLMSLIQKFDHIQSIDHSRLAEQAGVYTPPSIVTFFSNARVNSELLQLDPLIGLDLPYKVLCYAEPDTTRESMAFTSADFIRKRHGLTANDVSNYASDMDAVIQSFPEANVSPTNLEKVARHFGIISLESSFDFSTTVDRLKNVIMSQGDTKWFGEIDFQKEAQNLNKNIGKTTLLLFGGPAPGGKAMVDSPKLGLDAFCQKLLVYEHENGIVSISFNDIAAFANLYYGRSTTPQEAINNRLKATFEQAVSANR